MKMRWYVKFYICVLFMLGYLLGGQFALYALAAAWGNWAIPAGIVWVLAGIALVAHVFDPWLDND